MKYSELYQADVMSRGCECYNYEEMMFAPKLAIKLTDAFENYTFYNLRKELLLFTTSLSVNRFNAEHLYSTKFAQMKYKIRERAWPLLYWDNENMDVFCTNGCIYDKIGRIYMFPIKNTANDTCSIIVNNNFNADDIIYKYVYKLIQNKRHLNDVEIRDVRLVRNLNDVITIRYIDSYLKKLTIDGK